MHRNPEKMTMSNDNLEVVKVDVFNEEVSFIKKTCKMYMLGDI